MKNKNINFTFFSRNNSDLKKIKIKIFFKYLKISFFVLSFVMIIYSFIQSFVDPYVQYSSEPGSGLEFGFFPGSTNDYRYDVSSFEINPTKYHAFWTPTFKYGLFLSLLVFPISYLFNSLIFFIEKWNSYMEQNGLHVIIAMIFIIFLMRIITFLTSLRAAYYLDKQQHHKVYLDNINKKYESFSITDHKAKSAKQKEISNYNKKHGLKPFAAFENFFINTPIFLIVFKIITISRPIKFITLFGVWEFSKVASSVIFYEFFTKGWAYLFLCFLIIPINFFSQNIPNELMKKRHPKSNFSSFKDTNFENTRRIQQIMTLVFLLFTFFCSTALAIYYFINSIFNIFQSLLIHKILLRIKYQKNTFENKLRKLGV